MIKHLWLAASSLFVFFIALVLGMERAVFVMRAERAVGTVKEVSAKNARRGRHHRHCTKFTAAVTYADAEGQPFTIDVRAGSIAGWDVAVSRADLHEGDAVGVVYSPRDPSRAYRDKLTCVWETPLIAAGIGAAMLLGSATEGGRLRW